MKYFAVGFALNVRGIGECRLPEPYVYEAESIPQLVANLAPICEEENLTITFVRYANDAEVDDYLRGELEDAVDENDWDLTDYDEFWDKQIAEIDA